MNKAQIRNINAWHDIAGGDTPETGRYLAIDDDVYGEYTEIAVNTDIRGLAAEYLAEYELNDTGEAELTVAIYNNGEEEEAWTVNLNKTGITSWTLI